MDRVKTAGMQGEPKRQRWARSPFFPRAFLVSHGSLGTFVGTGPHPPQLSFFFKFFSFEFLFLEYHNLYTKFWCITSIYKFCQIIFKYKFDLRKTCSYNLYAQLLKE
jgi:hypothetical protein